MGLYGIVIFRYLQLLVYSQSFKTFKLIIDLHQSLKQFIVLAGEQSWKKLDLDIMKTAFFFSCLKDARGSAAENPSWIFENLSFTCPTLTLSARNDLQAKSMCGLTSVQNNVVHPVN